MSRARASLGLVVAVVVLVSTSERVAAADVTLTCYSQLVGPQHLRLDEQRKRVLRTYEGLTFGWYSAKFTDEYVTWNEPVTPQGTVHYRLDRYTGILSYNGSTEHCVVAGREF